MENSGVPTTLFIKCNLKVVQNDNAYSTAYVVCKDREGKIHAPCIVSKRVNMREGINEAVACSQKLNIQPKAAWILE